jgi:transketolase
MSAVSKMAEIRRRTVVSILQMYKQANAGHIGSSLSCIEILLDVLLNRAASTDKLLLSKGHAAAALYASLAEAGRLDPALLSTFYQDGTWLSAHPPTNRQIAEIPFGTGSLGHGLSLATGLALAERLKKRNGRVFCVVSDGDCQEGSTWEAALFAAHHRLDNLTLVVDRNHLQGFGTTEAVMELEPFVDKWSCFGFDTVHCQNGNSFAALTTAYESLKPGKPHCIVAETTKGHGVSFMAGKMEWHYLPMNDAQYARALADTEALASEQR